MTSKCFAYYYKVWGSHPGKVVERLHEQFCKQQSVKKNTHIYCVYGELGRMPLQNTCNYALVKFWIKYCSLIITIY